MRKVRTHEDVDAARARRQFVESLRMIDVVLFDVMGTLVHDPFYVEMPGFFGLCFEDWVRAKNPSVWVPFERGELTESELLASLFADARDFDHARFLAMLQASYRYLDGIEPLLVELKGRGVKMHAFSNYPVWYQLIDARLGLSRFLDWTFVSCHTRLRKPDPRAYEEALRVLGVAPDRCVFVDDRAENVDAATRAGMRGVVFEDAIRLRRTLAEWSLCEP